MTHTDYTTQATSSILNFITSFPCCVLFRLKIRFSHLAPHPSPLSSHQLRLVLAEVVAVVEVVVGVASRAGW